MLFRMEGLPIMDGKVGVGSLGTEAGTDAFCTFSFAGGKPIKTRVKTVKSTTRMGINPVFNVDLWYPVSIPTMTQVSNLLCLN